MPRLPGAPGTLWLSTLEDFFKTVSCNAVMLLNYSCGGNIYYGPTSQPGLKFSLHVGSGVREAGSAVRMSPAAPRRPALPNRKLSEPSTCGPLSQGTVAPPPFTHAGQFQSILLKHRGEDSEGPHLLAGLWGGRGGGGMPESWRRTGACDQSLLPRHLLPGRLGDQLADRAILGSFHFQVPGCLY